MDLLDGRRWTRSRRRRQGPPPGTAAARTKLIQLRRPITAVRFIHKSASDGASACRGSAGGPSGHQPTDRADRGWGVGVGGGGRQDQNGNRELLEVGTDTGYEMD